MLGDSLTKIPAGLTQPASWPIIDPHTGEEIAAAKSEGAPGSDDAPGSEVAPGDGKEPPIAIDRPFIFLSYSSDDRDQGGAKSIRELRRHLIEKGVPVWWDQDIESGAAWRETIKKRLSAAKAVLTFWTANSVQSNPVIEEASTAQSNKKLVHARLDDAELPYGFSETQYSDLQGWDTDSEGMAALIRALEGKLNPISRNDKVKAMRASSPAGFDHAAGKITAFARPPGARPENENIPDRDRRVSAQKTLVNDLIEDVQELVDGQSNFHKAPQLIKLLGRLLGSLKEDELNWVTLDDRMQLLRGMMNDDIDMLGAPDRITDALKLIDERHKELRPLVQPKQPPPDHPDAIKPPPYHSVAGADPDEAKKDGEELANIMQDEEADATTDDGVQHLIGNAAIDMAEAAGDIPAEGTASPEERSKKLGIFRRAVVKLAQYVGAFTLATTSAIAAGVLTNPVAATTLLDRIQPILDKLLQFF